MNRKEFLSIIPALSSLPFLSKEIIREKDQIIIPKPKEIVIAKDMPNVSRHAEMDRSRLQFLMVYDGQVVGSAAMTQIGMSEGHMEGYDFEIPMMVRTPRLSVHASFNADQVSGHIFQMLHHHSR